MATNTTKYNLIKPDGVDPVSVADINTNMDTIDGALAASEITDITVNGLTVTFTFKDGTTKTAMLSKTATQSAVGLMSASDKKKLDGIQESADAVTFTRSQTSGNKIGTIKINGTATDIYSKSYSTATYKESGLMSASDKTRFDDIGTVLTGTTSGTISTDYWEEEEDRTANGVWIVTVNAYFAAGTGGYRQVNLKKSSETTEWTGNYSRVFGGTTSTNLCITRIIKNSGFKYSAWHTNSKALTYKIVWTAVRIG
ncbi:MAG: hypothetical protein Q4C42_05195 [Clostridia bacterium]|nr:hypothetical protein [Clostridia bacterium]